MPSSDSRCVLHPVYLDVPMMVSFLAALRDGVSFEGETVKRSASSSEREAEGGARIRIPSLVTLLGFDASGRMGRKDQGEEGEEERTVRQHTSASLFNALYTALIDDQMVRRIGSPEAAGEISAGDIVEISGEFIGNPLESVLDFVAGAMPYVSLAESNPGLKEAIDGPPISMEVTQGELAALERGVSELEEEVAQARRSGSPARKGEVAGLEEKLTAKRQELEQFNAMLPLAETVIEGQAQKKGIEMMLKMRGDLRDAAVHDTVIEGPSGFKAVLTMSSEFFGEATTENLREGVFTAIGKVTRVLQKGESINLIRRTIMAAAGPEAARDLIKSATESEDIQIPTFDPIIEPPAVQILPVAVYI
jgi:hypothetical protein